MRERIEHLDIGSRSVTAVRLAPDSPALGPTFVYAPGAGSSIDDPFGAYLCGALADAGVATLRFQFPYMEAKQRRPDPPALLEATWRAAIAAAGPAPIIGGRSMGGRYASIVAAKGAVVGALALFAYPLKPPGSSNKPSRDSHFKNILVPTFFCSGTRDAFARPDELMAAAALIPQAEVHLLEGADHAFNTLKSSGRTRVDVWREATDALLAWLTQLD